MTHEELEKLFELMSHPMIAFDCGKLCSEAGGGMPICCNHNNFHPLLFQDELKWLCEHKEAGWKRFEPKSRFEKREVKEMCDHLVFADCPGIDNCDRDHRALVCRLFPFEPHVDSRGKVLGLAFITEDPEKCPLVSHPPETFSREYIQASMKAWQYIVDTYRAEKELYISESRKREKRAKRKGMELRVLS